MDKPEKTDVEIIRDGIKLVGPETNRQMSASIRRAMELADPTGYATLAAKHPLLFGPDSTERIKAEFPELFRPAKPKP